MAVPVDLGRVEAAVRVVENDTGLVFPLPARTVVQQLFVSFAADEGGFEVEMTDKLRHEALGIAYEGLDAFLRRVAARSKEVAARADYRGREIGFPVIIREIEGWAQLIKCHCWPR